MPSYRRPDYPAAKKKRLPAALAQPGPSPSQAMQIGAAMASLAAEQAEHPPCRVGGGYPQLAIRLMAAVGQRVAVQFTGDATQLGRAPGGQAFLVLDPDLDGGDQLTPGRRAAVLAAGQDLANALNLKVAAVFSPLDAVYFRPGKAATPSSQPPVLALDLPNVQFVHPPDPTKH